MSSLQVFEYGSNDVRTMLIDGKPWFVLGDLCAVLGLGSTSRVAQRLHAGNVSRAHVTDTVGRQRSTIIVDKPAMIDVFLDSTKPRALKFREWLVTEVIPSIMSTGAYGTPHPMATKPSMDLSSIADIEAILGAANAALAMVKVAIERAEVAEERLGMIAPKAEAFAVLTAARGDYSVGQAAKLLSGTPGIANIGRNRLFEWLRDNGWVMDNNEPKQAVMNADLMDADISEYLVHHRDGTTSVAPPTARITVKGLDKIRRLMIAQNATTAPLRAIESAPRKRKRKPLTVHAPAADWMELNV